MRGVTWVGAQVPVCVCVCVHTDGLVAPLAQKKMTCLLSTLASFHCCADFYSFMDLLINILLHSLHCYFNPIQLSNPIIL